MRVLPKMVDMARTPEQKAEAMAPPSISNQPDYPWGLSISLTQDELEKLNLDDDDVEVGDMIHLFALAKVTSVSKNDTSSGKTTRIELQLTHMSAEDEDEENGEADEEEDRSPIKRLYR